MQLPTQKREQNVCDQAFTKSICEMLGTQEPMNTLEKVRDCMAKLQPRIELPEEILRRARLPIERMLEISAR
jgi:quinolinate synthase